MYLGLSLNSYDGQSHQTLILLEQFTQPTRMTQLSFIALNLYLQ